MMVTLDQIMHTVLGTDSEIASYFVNAYILVYIDQGLCLVIFSTMLTTFDTKRDINRNKITPICQLKYELS